LETGYQNESEPAEPAVQRLGYEPAYGGKGR